MILAKNGTNFDNRSSQVVCADERSEDDIKMSQDCRDHGEGEALVSHWPICFYVADGKTGIIRVKES